MSALPVKPSGRLEFLDVIRGVFILIMIEGHTLRALLDPSAQTGTIYRAQDLLHNMTGPVFLFASGAAFVYSTRKHWDLYRNWGPKLRARLGRWLGLVVAGYALQLSYGTLARSLRETTPYQLSSLLSINSLQCIGLSLLLLQMVASFAPDVRWFFRVTAGGAVAIAFLTPFAWIVAGSWPLWLGSVISGRTLSVFPLFPYTGFTFAGAAWAYLHCAARDQGREESFLNRSGQICAVTALACSAFAILPVPKIYSDFWTSSPQFFLMRVGLLGLLAAGVRQMEPKLLPRARVLAVAGRESLLIYVVHLVILFGTAFNPDTNLAKNFGIAKSASQAIAVWLLFTMLLLVFASAWNWWKKDRGWQVTGLRWTFVSYIAYIFFIR